jgi:two-component system phosphate regulon response regulator PhoB
MKAQSTAAGVQRLTSACLIATCENYGLPVDILFFETIDDASLVNVRRHAQRQDQITLVFYSLGTMADEVRLLEAGADECFRVSFSVERLQAQLNTLARRRSNSAGPMIDGLGVDERSFQATLHGRPLRMGPQEFRLLAELWKQRGQIVPHEILEQALFGETGADCRQGLRQLVHRLRQRLTSAGSLIHVVPRVGYTLRAPEPVEVRVPMDLNAKRTRGA